MGVSSAKRWWEERTFQREKRGFQWEKSESAMEPERVRASLPSNENEDAGRSCRREWEKSNRFHKPDARYVLRPKFES